MYQINFNIPEKIHFIGIGGISMSGLAEILLDRHFIVTGSDRADSPLVSHLRDTGATVFIGQEAEHITDDIHAVVYTAAVHPDNPEFKAAKEKNIPMLTRAELLGQLMKNYHTAIGISGTHGKTTTTSMLSQILLETEMNPTISVGGILPAIRSNYLVGGNQVFVTEACEYTNSFLSLFPTMELVLNIEADHLDFFSGIEEIRQSFHTYMKRLPENGTLIVNHAIRDLDQLTSDLTCNVITFGESPDADYSCSDVAYDELGNPSYVLHHHDEALGTIQLKVPGQHNIDNSLAAIAAACTLGVPMETVILALSKFTGAERRFEKKGEIAGITVIDDYAHHPQEITATLQAAKKYPHKKIWCVFQPHTYTRTKALMDDFAKSLSLADNVILADIYPARETDNLGISSKNLADKIQVLGTDVHYFPSFGEIIDFILENCSHGDLLITMGAGDVVKIGEMLLGTK